jgi:hypothetical protein
VRADRPPVVRHDLTVRSREAGTRAGAILWIVAAVVAIAGAVLLVVGLGKLSDASSTRDDAARLRREARAATVRTERIERGADSPITQAEAVASSVSAIVDAGDTVVQQSASTSDVLGRAVDLANDGNLSAARNLYGGEAATSVRDLEAELARARAALAAAQQAVAELVGPNP